MKLLTATALAAFLATADAFAVQSSQGAVTSALQMSAVEAPPAEAEAAPQRGPTRFDRKKKLYKGIKSTASDEDLIFSYADFAKAVAETSYSFERYSIVKGTCVEYDNNGAIVDIGAKATAFLPQSETALVQPEGTTVEDWVPLNQEMEFEIISDEDENGQLLVSVRRIQYRAAWDKVVALETEDDVIEAEVIAVNRGGAICLVEGLRAFLPGSHLTGQLPTEDIIGQTLPLKFLEVDKEKNKLVVSNRRAVVEQQMAELSRGDLVDGLVKALKPYGAFVEVGGMSGLLHISQISLDRINDLEAVLQPGMKIKCMIIDHDKVNGRIALSTKSLEYEPGAMIKDPQQVFERAEETAVVYHRKMEEQRKASENKTRDMIMGLGDPLDEDSKEKSGDAKSDVADPLADVSDNLDSLLS